MKQGFIAYMSCIMAWNFTHKTGYTAACDVRLQLCNCLTSWNLIDMMIYTVNLALNYDNEFVILSL